MRRATRTSRIATTVKDVSIHAPHAEGDMGATVGSVIPTKFQSTPPMRRATVRHRQDGHQSQVSIHAPHAEGDPCGDGAEEASGRFNPRPPCGGRLRPLVFSRFEESFQSTPPMRRATGSTASKRRTYLVSIHAPHAEGDWRTMRLSSSITCFNPRPPCGGRHAGTLRIPASEPFQSTPPMRRAT